ncbi:MAG: hypothetical protein IJ343_10950 [Clostridia bacterium]|nr:hypothetical protein [Clostridia bacterium]
MKKRLILALALILCLCVLTACQTSEPQKFTVKTSGGTTQQTQVTNSTQLWTDDSGYDPLAEEDDYTGDVNYWAGDLATPVPSTATPAPTIRGEYAGATPVPIDPIDKPTPTQVPPLAAFSYKTYEATKLGLSFEGPVGWVVDDYSTPNTYIIQNPSIQGVKYAATLTVYAGKVNSQYSESDLKAEVQSMLKAVGASDVVVTFSPSDTASRTLLDAKGVYANYSATLENGAEISGRVHATCVEKVLYTVHLSAPKAYWEQYKDQVYDKLRATIKITK